MRLNYLEVLESGPILHVFTPQGIEIARVLMPPDNQHMMNFKYMDEVTKLMAIRWGVIHPKKNSYNT